MRAAAVKSELSDAEGLGFKLEEKNNEIVELKKTIRLKVSGGSLRIEGWGLYLSGNMLSTAPKCMYIFLIVGRINLVFICTYVCTLIYIHAYTMHVHTHGTVCSLYNCIS